jgi:hypothetical protein
VQEEQKLINSWYFVISDGIVVLEPRTSISSSFSKYHICLCIAALKYLGQEFGNDDNSYISCSGFYLCGSKIFAIAFAALWLSFATCTVICQ